MIPQKIGQTVKDIRKDLGAEYEALDYKEMMPDLIQAKEVDTAGSQIILMVLYLIIGFGNFWHYSNDAEGTGI